MFKPVKASSSGLELTLPAFVHNVNFNQRTKEINKLRPYYTALLL